MMDRNPSIDRTDFDKYEKYPIHSAYEMKKFHQEKSYFRGDEKDDLPENAHSQI